MKKIISILCFALGCTGITPGVQVDPSAILELFTPEKEALVAGLTRSEALGAIAVASQTGEEPEAEEPSTPPWQPEPRWIHMFGADGNLIVDGDFRYEERVADDMPFELRLRMYNTQAEFMNRPVSEGGDPRCTCTVMHGGYGGGI